MKLTKKSDYAARVLTYLHTQSMPIPMPSLSQEVGIQYNNVMKLIQMLVKKKVLGTKQGSNGGVYLTRSLSEITLRELIEWVEGPIFFADCFHEDCTCQFSPSCQIKHVFSDVQTKMNQLLDNVTLMDMVPKHSDNRIINQRNDKGVRSKL